MPLFLANRFLALNFDSNKQNVVFLLKSIKFKQKLKRDLRPENCFLEIKASNLEGPLLKFQYSSNIFLLLPWLQTNCI